MEVEFDPEDFDPEFEGVGCFIEHNGDIIVVHRHESRPYGNTFGLPSGKIEPGESPKEAIIRETWEETGLVIDNPELLKIYEVRYPEFDFRYYLYRIYIKEKMKLELNTTEHNLVLWIKPEELYGKKLIPGFKKFLDDFYQ